MAKRRSPLVDYLVYLLVRVILVVVRVLPWSLALALARLLARLAYRLDHRHRQVALENLRHAFPDLDDLALDRLVRSTYEHFLLVAIEIIRMPDYLNPHNYKEYTHWLPAEGERIAIEWSRTGRPILLLTGHLGNWELLSYTFGLAGFHAGVIARRLDNPYLDRICNEFRKRTGQVVLDKNHDYERILAYLTQGRFIGIVGDQDAGARGLFVDFLGRPASTFKSIALLSLEYLAPILVVGSARVGSPMRYRFCLEDVILPEQFADHPDAVRAITERYTASLERMVRRHPEQYFWLHRRWKHQPRTAHRKEVVPAASQTS